MNPRKLANTAASVFATAVRLTCVLTPLVLSGTSLPEQANKGGESSRSPSSLPSSAVTQPSPQTAAATTLLQKALHALSAKRYDEVMARLGPLIQAQSRDPRVWTARGLALAGLGRTRESLASFEEALRLRPNFVPALEGTAQVEYASGDSHGRASLERVLAIRPGNETAHAMLGALTFERGDCEAAVSHFEKSESEVGQNAKALAQFGYCLISTNRSEKATGIFRRILLLQPSDPQARFNLGLAQFLSHDYQGAIATLRPLAEGYVPDPDVLNLSAQAYEGDHQTEAALAALRKATEIAPKDVRNYLDLAALCMDHGAYALGIEIVDVGVNNIPDSAALYAMRGILRAQTMQFDEAETDFRRANQLQPDQVYGTVGLGITSMQRGNPEDSVRILRERLARNPQDPALNYLLAEALLRKGIEPRTPEFDEAKPALLRSIKGKPDFAKAHAQLSKLYLLAGDTAKALKESELAVQLAPEDRMAVYSLVRALKESGRNEEAKPLLLKLREIDARDLKEEADKNRVKLVRAAPPRRSER